MSLMIRWATRWDRKIIVEMLTSLAEQHESQTDPDKLSASFDYALGHPDRVRFAVAMRDDRVIGMASLQDAYSTWQNCPYGTIEDVYVLPDERCTGAGMQLMALLVEEARRRGYCRVELQVHEDNDTAWKFYEARGFSFTGHLVYRLELAAEE